MGSWVRGSPLIQAGWKHPMAKPLPSSQSSKFTRLLQGLICCPDLSPSHSQGLHSVPSIPHLEEPFPFSCLPFPLWNWAHFHSSFHPCPPSQWIFQQQPTVSPRDLFKPQFQSEGAMNHQNSPDSCWILRAAPDGCCHMARKPYFYHHLINVQPKQSPAWVCHGRRGDHQF